jgi:hypothetical protein
LMELADDGSRQIVASDHVNAADVR